MLFPFPFFGDLVRRILDDPLNEELRKDLFGALGVREG